QAEECRHRDQPRVGDPAARVLVDPVGARQPEDGDEEDRQVPHHEPRARVEEVVDAVEQTGIVGRGRRVGSEQWVHGLEEQLPDDVPRGERDSCKGAHDDRCEDVDTQPPLTPNRTSSRPALRSASRYSDPVTRTAPCGPAIDRARTTAAPGSRSVSVLSNHRLASVASSSADRARVFPDAVATNVSPTAESAASIPSAFLSRRIEATTTYCRSGSRGSSQPTPSRLCAPSQISSGALPRRSSRPGTRTPSAAEGSTGRPR